MSSKRIGTRTSVALLLATTMAACESADPPAPAASENPSQAIQQLDRLTARLGSGAAVTNPEFQAAMEPFASSDLRRWAEDQVMSASSSLNQLRIALVERYDLVAPYCAEDGLVRYSTCGDGYACVAAAQVIEVRCLWFASMGS